MLFTMYNLQITTNLYIILEMEVRKAIYTTSAFESLNALSETEPPEEYQYLQTFIYTLEFEDEISALIRKCS